MRCLFFLFLSTILVRDISAQEPHHGFDLSIYEGSYILPDGDSLFVIVAGDGLAIEMPGGNLFRFSDYRADSRILEVERRTLELMDAMVQGDRSRIAALFGSSSGPMEEYISSTLEIISPAFAEDAESSRYEVVATVYRDEDSDYGFEDSGWGWQTYIRFFDGPEDVMVRLVWDGVSGSLMHRGIGGTPPIATRLHFELRNPARSWIRAYDPSTQTTKRLREVERSSRSRMTPARFSAYDVDTHQTVGLRFRRDMPEDSMRIEIGPLGSEVQRVGYRVRLHSE